MLVSWISYVDLRRPRTAQDFLKVGECDLARIGRRTSMSERVKIRLDKPICHCAAGGRRPDGIVAGALIHIGQNTIWIAKENQVGTAKSELAVSSDCLLLATTRQVDKVVFAQR